jgi:hypothetical protein
MLIRPRENSLVPSRFFWSEALMTDLGKHNGAVGLKGGHERKRYQ